MDDAPRCAAPARPRAAHPIALVFALASALGVNPYLYGVGDNRITVPFAKAYADPRLYPGDYLLAQREFYYTLLWKLIGALDRLSGIRLEVWFFGFYLVALYFTFLGIERLAWTLFRRPAAGWLAMLVLLFSRPSLAGVNTIEQVLNTRQVALPFLLFALDSFLGGRI